MQRTEHRDEKCRMTRSNCSIYSVVVCDIRVEKLECKENTRSDEIKRNEEETWPPSPGTRTKSPLSLPVGLLATGVLTGLARVKWAAKLPWS